MRRTRFLGFFLSLLASGSLLVAQTPPSPSTSPEGAEAPAPSAIPVAPALPAPAATATPPPAAPAKLKTTYNSIHTSGPFVALTFDDGPHQTLTPKLLDILAKRNVKATFFVLGQRVEAHPEIARRIVRDGHEIADHTWSHPNLGKMGDGAVRQQLDRTRQIIRQVTGVTPKVFRPPYGSFTERQRRWAMEEYGYPTIIWDVDPLDWKRPGAGVVAQRIISRTTKGSIILMHDIHAGSIEAVPQVLDTLLAKGYRFLTVSDLIARDEPKPPAPPRPAASAAPKSAAQAAPAKKAPAKKAPAKQAPTARPAAR